MTMFSFLLKHGTGGMYRHKSIAFGRHGAGTRERKRHSQLGLRFGGQRGLVRSGLLFAGFELEQGGEARV